MERSSIGKTRASKLLNRRCQSGSNARAGVVEMRLAGEPDQNSVRSAPTPLSFSYRVIDKKVLIASSSLSSSTEWDSFHLHPYTHRLTLRLPILHVYSHTLLLPRTDLFPQIYYNRHLSHSEPHSRLILLLATPPEPESQQPPDPAHHNAAIDVILDSMKLSHVRSRERRRDVPSSTQDL